MSHATNSSPVEVIYTDTTPKRHKGNKIRKSNPSPTPTPPTTEETQTFSKTPTPTKRVLVKSSSKISHEFLSVPTPLSKSASSTYTMEEIATHNTAEDCWVVVKNKVYDVSTMVAQHPGSSRAVLLHAGTMCDEDFDFHSKAARQFWLKHYCIGRVEGTSDGGVLASCTIC
jgi:cytochrome b involved in lipid metabolism|tara:strand:- start:1274 stop:1786 length:513 start_codon:yes stop_codon:yes gene_type:complete